MTTGTRRTLSLAAALLAAASLLLACSAGAGTTLGPSPSTVTVEQTSGAATVQFDVSINDVTNLTGWQFYIYNPSSGPTISSVAAGGWWNNPPCVFYSNSLSWGCVVLGYTSDGSGKSGNGAVAHVTVNYSGAAPGTYVFAIDNTELVNTDSQTIDHTVTDFTLIVEAAAAPAPLPVLTITGKTTTSLSMQSSACTDRTPPVKYQFNKGTPSPGTLLRDWDANVDATCGSLTANTHYTFRVRAKDSTVEENTTNWSADVAAYTLPVAPNVTCDKSTSGKYPVSTAFTFTNAAGFGAGSLDHYHYAWNKLAAYTFTGGETAWSAGTLALPADSAGTWYLHVMSHDPTHDSGGTQDLGAYDVGGVPATPENFRHTANALNSITWAWDDKSSDETGFRVDPPGGTVGSGVTSWTETPLSVNTAYTRHVHATNAYGDSLPSNNHAAYTAIEQPTGVTFGNVTTSAIEAKSTSDPSNLTSGNSGLIVRNTTASTDSGWKQNNTLWNSTPLVANKTYTFTAEARNGDGDVTGPCAGAVKWTLPVAPNVTCDKGLSGHYPTNTVFTFANTAGWGESKLDHYHHAWNKQAAYTFTGAEPTWNAGTQALTANSAGNWYLHVQSQNGEHASNGTQDIGPFDVGDLPAAPTGFTHTANATNSITWAWTDASNNETGFRVDPPGGTVGQGVTSWPEGSLSTNTAYTRHVHATNLYGDSPASNDHTAYTAIETPTGVTFGGVTATTIVLNATGSLSNLTSGNSGVYFNETGGHNGGINEWVQVATDTATGLSPNTQYTFAAKASNGDGDETAYSATGQKFTLASAPGAEVLSNVTANSIRANWNAGTPANPVGTQYFAECWIGAGFGGTKFGDSGWTTSLNAVFSGLAPNTQYSFRVKAKNGENVETAWTDLGSAVTLANPPGALTIDMQVMSGPALNLTAPGCRSLTILSIGLNGNPASTLIAIKVGTGAGNWLSFVDDGSGHVDVYANGTAEEWHTAAEWAGKRLRGLTPNTAYSFSAKAKNTQGQESALVAVGSYSTNKDGDVNRSGSTTIMDLVNVRSAVLTGGSVGVHYSWATDVNDDSYRRTDVGDMTVVRNIILNP